MQTQSHQLSPSLFSIRALGLNGTTPMEQSLIRVSLNL